jgi:pimeloyl-ACP methyl ester carboxylesterase
VADAPEVPVAALFQVAPTLFGLGAQAGIKRVACSPFVSAVLALAFGAIGWTPAVVRGALLRLVGQQPYDFALNMFRAPLLRNVACMANDEFVQLEELQPVASIMANLRMPVKLLCAQQDPWVPADYVLQYKTCENATCSVDVSSEISHRFSLNPLPLFLFSCALVLNTNFHSFV